MIKLTIHKSCLKEWGYRIGLCTFTVLITSFILNWIRSGYSAYVSILVNMPLFLCMSLGLYLGLCNNYQNK